jgi:hypothetical protein
MITAILLIPTELYREALIGDGPCGSRAPQLVLFGGKWRDHLPRGVCVLWDDPDSTVPLPVYALVLAWDGKPVADGLGRSLRAGGAHETAAAIAALNLATIEGIIAWARALEDWGLGRIVLIDAAGKEEQEGKHTPMSRPEGWAERCGMPSHADDCDCGGKGGDR